MKELLLLSPEDFEKNKPTKILGADLSKKQSFNAGLNFYFETLEYDCFHQAMDSVFKYDNSFIVLGELTDYGQALEESRKAGPRRKKKGNPSIQDRDGTEIVLDLDDHILPKFDALNPEPAIKDWLGDKGIDCDVTWQITSGQKLNTEEARIRLYFEASKPLPLLERKAWAQSPAIQADGSVFTCSQPIYTAPPVIEGGVDPIPKRFGFLKGERPTLKLPKMTVIEVDQYSGYHRGGASYDLNDPEIPEEVLNGSVYRRYFMPLAFHYANKLKGDREAIFAIISVKAMQVKAREFDAENTYAYIDDAIAKINTEDESKSIQDGDLITASDIESEAKGGLETPVFPSDLMSNWPEPWAMIWDNFKRVPRQVEEPLLVPTVLSINAFFLRSNFVTAYNRRPNMFFLNLTPSTGNKDVNSKNVIRDLDLIFKKRGLKSSIFSGILNTESNITADTTFLQSFNESEELFWINTEATRIFQQIKMAGSVSAVAALSDKLIEVVDGHEITGKIKAAGKVKTIQNPNAQVLFYAQPETIERYIDESMVDSGLFGRSLLSIVPELKFIPEEYEMFKIVGGVNAEIDDEFVDFYTSTQFELTSLSSSKTVLQPTKASRDLLNQWAREYVAPKMAGDEALQKVLSRIGNSAEQLYCIILGICQIYDAFIGAETRTEIDVGRMIPLLEYWVDTKIYAIKHFIVSEIDPLHAGILEVVRKGVAGGYKVKINTTKIIKDYSVFPKPLIIKNVKQNQTIVRKLIAKKDDKHVSQRIEKELDLMCRSGILKSVLVRDGTRKTQCYGILKE